MFKKSLLAFLVLSLVLTSFNHANSVSVCNYPNYEGVCCDGSSDYKAFPSGNGCCIGTQAYYDKQVCGLNTPVSCGFRTGIYTFTPTSPSYSFTTNTVIDPNPGLSNGDIVCKDSLGQRVLCPQAPVFSYAVTAGNPGSWLSPTFTPNPGAVGLNNKANLGAMIGALDCGIAVISVPQISFDPTFACQFHPPVPPSFNLGFNQIVDFNAPGILTCSSGVIPGQDCSTWNFGAGVTLADVFGYNPLALGSFDKPSLKFTSSSTPSSGEFNLFLNAYLCQVPVTVSASGGGALSCSMLSAPSFGITPPTLTPSLIVTVNNFLPGSTYPFIYNCGNGGGDISHPLTAPSSGSSFQTTIPIACSYTTLLSSESFIATGRITSTVPVTNCLPPAITTVQHLGSGGVCGDGIYGNSPGEQCDDGNAVSGDGCSSCMLDNPAACGDGTTGPGETCDDGNKNSGDGCDQNCQLESSSVGNGPYLITEAFCPGTVNGDSSTVSFEVIDTATGAGACDRFNDPANSKYDAMFDPSASSTGLTFIPNSPGDLPPTGFYGAKPPTPDCVKGVLTYHLSGLSGFNSDNNVAEYTAKLGIKFTDPVTGNPVTRTAQCNFRDVKQRVQTPELSPLLVALVGLVAFFALRSEKHGKSKKN